MKALQQTDTRITRINRALAQFCQGRLHFNGIENEPASACHAGSDGDCYDRSCPQQAEGGAFYQKGCPLWHVEAGDHAAIAEVHAIVAGTHPSVAS